MKKLRGSATAPSELTRLKALWRSGLKPAQREMILGWHDDPATTNAMARQGLEKVFGIKLSRDGQLSQFWGWLEQQSDYEATNELLENFEEFTRTRNPDWSPEKVRSVALEFFIAHTVKRRDPAKFATIMQIDQAERFGQTKAGFEREKIDISKRKLNLLETKAKQADAARGILTNPELSEEQKAARMRENFGIV
jgi:hypothetical protein